ncbi:hypothetical protein [Pseudoalteromonas phenolica]|uniref:hypothetical protein n=1 Tax=Pseudoalteromonas phenolica TaxID=161398 RepID=UPI00110B03DD|nr:hypothetical protein [Pseudoalteromonas phenolica]TMO57124.1 hypothetical protein CWC21_04355 [Pseudoalteromonas phenolica]
MQKLFNSYIKKYQFQPYERLFDKSIKEYIKTDFTDNESKIYAIVETPKVKYIPESFYPIGNFSFVGDVVVDDIRHTIMINIAKTWFETESVLSQGLRNKFASLGDFTDYFMGLYGPPERPNLSSSEKYSNIAQVDLQKSTENILFISCPLAKAMNGGKDCHAELHIYQMINMFEIECLGNLEIVYIGKSISSTFERLRKHEKWGPILANQKGKYDHLVYFLEIEDNELSNYLVDNVRFFKRDFNNLPEDPIVKLCEASLINFYKPKFNEDHKCSDLAKSELVTKWLTKNSYNQLVTEIELDGLLGRIGSPVQPYQVRHEVRLEL